MTQIVLQVEDNSLIPTLKKLFESLKGVKIIEDTSVVETKKYSKEFSDMIKQGENDFNEGKGKKIKTADLWK